MTIKSIEIKNVKGIKHKRFNLNILRNKPSILVAPNGFGKSSLAISFNSLKQNKIDLPDDSYHENNSSLNPSLSVEIELLNGVTKSLIADQSTNLISKSVSCFVIKPQLKAKSTGKNFGGFRTNSASLVIEPIELISSIPSKSEISYSISETRKDFGPNAKILPNIKQLLANDSFLSLLSQNYKLLDKFSGVKAQSEIQQLNDFINSLSNSMTANQMLSFLEANELYRFNQFKQLRDLNEVIKSFDTGFKFETELFLASLQVVYKYVEDKQAFKDCCKYHCYLLEKNKYRSLLSNLNTSSWQKVELKENTSKRQLVAHFPKANNLSNGQRDLLVFICLLEKAKIKLKKKDNILIIDEIFDYLDDANLVAAKYYVSNLIQQFKENDRSVYPLILSHINPKFFSHYVFNNKKVYFLDQRKSHVTHSMKMLLKKRNDEAIKYQVAHSYLHYSPAIFNLRQEFRELGLKETWGDVSIFDNFIDSHMHKYLSGEHEYDPLAVCAALRKKVEKNIYDMLDEQLKRDEFIDQKETIKKLKYADKSGVEVPKTYFILSIIYNEGLHWKEHVDLISPIVSNLEHLVFRKLILDIY